MNEFITGFLKVILLLSSYFGVGYFLLFSFNKKKGQSFSFYMLFLSLFVGLLSVVTLTSLFITKGFTVNVIMLPILIYLLYSFRSSKLAVETDSYSAYNHPFFVVFIGILLLYTYCYFIFGNYYNNQDYLFYSKISYYLFKTGYENDYHIFNLIDKDYHAVTPYHYFDLWLNAVNYFSWQTQSNLDTFLKTTSTVLLVSVFSGFLAIYEAYKKIDFIGVLLSLCIIFFGGFYFPFFKEFNLLNVFEYCFTPYSVFNFAKFTPTVLFLLVIFICFKKENKLTALLLFSSLSVVSVVNVPGVGFALFLSLTVLFFFKKQQQYVAMRDIAIAFIPLLSVVAFYLIFGNKVVARGGTTSGAITELIISLFSVTVLFKKIKIIGGASIALGSVYFLAYPLVLKFAKEGKDDKRRIELFFIFMVLTALTGGLLAWSILAPKMNAIQPFYYFLKALPVVLFIIICSGHKNLISKILIATVLCFSLWNIYQAVNSGLKNKSKEEMTVLYANISNKVIISGSVGVLKDSSDYRDISSYYPTCYSLGIPLTTHIDPLFGISLSDYSLPITNEPELDKNYKEGIQMGAFYRFVQKQQKNHTFQNIETSQIDFIKKINIKYLIVSHNVFLPDKIKEITDTIIDIPQINEKLLLLKY